MKKRIPSLFEFNSNEKKINESFEMVNHKELIKIYDNLLKEAKKVSGKMIIDELEKKYNVDLSDETIEFNRIFFQDLVTWIIYTVKDKNPKFHDHNIFIRYDVDEGIFKFSVSSGLDTIWKRQKINKIK